MAWSPHPHTPSLSLLPPLTASSSLHRTLMKPSGKEGWQRCYRVANPLAEPLYRSTPNTLNHSELPNNHSFLYQ
ncbi:hypothetical protein HanRHA438_Chr01g0024021 [Helianthus annuus]|nr:hypothetical protein HanRHA438_Chr01g0024021 [Helianthus annuus]